MHAQAIQTKNSRCFNKSSNTRRRLPYPSAQRDKFYPPMPTESFPWHFPTLKPFTRSRTNWPCVGYNLINCPCAPYRGKTFSNQPEFR